MKQPRNWKRLKRKQTMPASYTTQKSSRFLCYCYIQWNDSRRTPIFPGSKELSGYKPGQKLRADIEKIIMNYRGVWRKITYDSWNENEFWNQEKLFFFQVSLIACSFSWILGRVDLRENISLVVHDVTTFWMLLIMIISFEFWHFNQDIQCRIRFSIRRLWRGELSGLPKETKGIYTYWCSSTNKIQPRFSASCKTQDSQSHQNESYILHNIGEELDPVGNS